MPGKRYSTEQIAATLREAERLQGQARASQWVSLHAHRLLIYWWYDRSPARLGRGAQVHARGKQQAERHEGRQPHVVRDRPEQPAHPRRAVRVCRRRDHQHVQAGESTHGWAPPARPAPLAARRVTPVACRRSADRRACRPGTQSSSGTSFVSRRPRLSSWRRKRRSGSVWARSRARRYARWASPSRPARRSSSARVEWKYR